MNNTHESESLREYLATAPNTLPSGYAIYKKFGVAKSTAYSLLKEYGYAPNTMTGQWERKIPKNSFTKTQSEWDDLVLHNQELQDLVSRLEKFKEQALKQDASLILYWEEDEEIDWDNV